MNNSLKKITLVSFLIYIIGFTLLLGSLYMYNYYNSQMKKMHYQQKLVLTNVQKETVKLFHHIENISEYIKDKYASKMNLLSNLVGTHQNISNIIILNKEGIIEDISVEGLNNIYKGFDYSKKKYFTKMNRYTKTFWSDAFLSSVNNEPTLTYSFKMGDKIVVLFVKLFDLDEFAKRFRNEDSSYTVRIFDKNSVFLINPDGPELVKQKVNAKDTSLFKDLIFKIPAFTLGKVSSSFNKKVNIAMYTKLDINGWYIVSRQSYEAFEKFITYFVLTASLSMLFIIAIGLSFGLKIQRKVSLSYDSLLDSIEKITDGNYSVDVKKSNYIEFNSLISNFTKMKNEIIKRERVLGQSAESFKSLVDSTMEAIIIHDTNICLDVNLAALKLFGYKNKIDMINLKFLDLISKDDISILRKNLFKNTQPYEFKILTKDKKEIECLGRGVFLEINNKRLKVTAIINISELKAKDKLLSQQSKLAAMGEMIENIAHQWRQPLSTISTAASGLQINEELEIDTKDNRLKSLELIMENSQYLSKTIDDFRNFFKLDKELVIVKVEDVLSNVIRLIKPMLSNNNMELLTNIEPELTIKGYKNEFLQSLINIINNSKDAFVINNIKTRVVRIDCFKINKKTIIKISDSAGGIKNKNINKIFDPYFTTKHKSQGTGIGLYMTHQMLVDHMHAKLDVYNDMININNNFYEGLVFEIEFNS